MQARGSIVNIPLLIGLLLSIALHVAALYSKGLHTPPKPHFEAGRTVVHLTLAPSAASQAAPAPAETPEPEEPIEEAVEKAAQKMIPVPEPATVPMPAPAPPEAAKPFTEPVPKERTVDSVEQDASRQEDKGVITGASVTSVLRPVYPRISRRRNEEGLVTLSVEVLSSGRAGQIEVIKSSGYKRLDDAASTAVRKAVFSPATQFGRNIDSTTELSFTFRLDDD